MAELVPFEQVLAYLEEHGWELVKIWPPYRMFSKPGRLPIMVPVEDKMVTVEYAEKVKQAVEKDERESAD